jgi:UTP--glucose-1-phosphate uridylyltransferase
MKAIVELGLQREELRPQLLEYLEILLQKELGKEKLRRRVV